MYRILRYLIFMACSFLLLQDCGDFKNNSDKVNSTLSTPNSVTFVAVGRNGTIVTSSNGTSWLQGLLGFQVILSQSSTQIVLFG